ncbi:MAG: protein kinase [Dokdonella sp.]
MECAGDADLLRTVTSWLIADSNADDFLERPLCAGVLDDSGEHAVDANSDIAGAMFGPYRALRPIGIGGMGEVWLAARADGEFEQQVAIKRLLYPTPELVRRFRHERRMLAGLQHPHIAQLHDGGVGTDGAPYFVMEYVDGEPITVYCDANHCGLRARVALILQVCSAVQYAHRNLIVHRDLKPSNVLVDADGQVKLLDFGIAKLLESTDGSDEATATLVQRMTPDYAAPEQILGEAVTTATDVYALGVLLFELLAGERPFKFGRVRGELERAMAATTPSASAIAARSIGTQRNWANRLRGDLDRIISKAMAKEPERRYASAETLSDDLRAYLSGRPVIARGDDAGYRLRKFVGRNRTGAVAVVAIALAMIAATAISLQQARVAQRQAQRADAEKSFVLGILDANNPDDTQGKGETLTARQILDRAAERLDKDLATQPAVRALLKNEIGDIYWDYGQYSRALPLLEQAVQLAEATGLPGGQRVAFMIDLGKDQRILRHLADASSTFRKALDLARATDGADSELDINVRSEYSVTLAYAARFDEAEAQARQVMGVVSQRHSKGTPEYSAALDTLAFSLGAHLHQAEAVDLRQQQLAVNERLHPQLHSAVSITSNDLGLALFDEGRLPQAETSLRRALAMHAQLLGKSHPHYGINETNLARVLDREGHFDEAQVMLADGLEIKRRALGEESDMLDSSYRALALNALNRGDAAVAEANARRALELDLRTYGTRQQNPVESQIVLGTVLLNRGAFVEAERLLQTAAATGDEIYGRPNDASGYARALQARSLARRGDVNSAMRMFETALAALRASVGEQHFEYADALTWQGDAELARGDIQRADGTAQKALTSARASYPVGDALIADSLLLQAHVDLALGRSADALPLLREALALRKAALRSDDPRITEIESALRTS